ncbi:ACH1-like protein [Mya arenaria]|uniref:ACH1-like protein n=1 Tax=Mya arenaria TaxID=6604 RepID=A0ABY7DTP8_MYAAR|nr:ACH1-like protein [Mya arenaria]
MKMSVLCAILVPLLAMVGLTHQMDADIQTMKQLYKNTLDGYDTRIRPINNQSAAVFINTKFTPQSLLEFDTSEQKFSMLGYFKINWVDEVVRWDPTTFGETKEIKAYDGHGVVGTSTDLAKVLHNGFVHWEPEGIYSVVCNVDIQYYPFDEQVCVITYYVSDETIRTVVLDHYLNVDMSEYSENSAWTIASTRRSRYLMYNTYHIDIEFRLQRRANFTTFTLIMPLLMLAFLNICIFLVPIGSGEKGSFSITIFLSYGIFVTIISDTLPHNSLQVSFFVLFIVILLILSVISVFYTIIQAKIVAAVGDKECPWTIFKPGRRAKGPDEVERIKDNKEKEAFETLPEQEEEEEVYTWSMFLEKLDIVLFVLFFIVIITTTAVFFWMLLRHASRDNPEPEDPSPTLAYPTTTTATM